MAGGTGPGLFAFILVNVGVIILRRTKPDMPRPFKVPFSPVFPVSMSDRERFAALARRTR